MVCHLHVNFLQVLFNAVMENACSEQGARMSAMDSSSRNAGDMLDRLTLTYNRLLSLDTYACWESYFDPESIFSEEVMNGKFSLGNSCVWYNFWLGRGGGGGASRFFSLKEPCSNLSLSLSLTHTHTHPPTNSSLIISPFHQYTKHV
jgi:hypothetical protein